MDFGINQLVNHHNIGDVDVEDNGGSISIISPPDVDGSPTTAGGDHGTIETVLDSGEGGSTLLDFDLSSDAVAELKQQFVSDLNSVAEVKKQFVSDLDAVASEGCNLLDELNYGREDDAQDTVSPSGNKFQGVPSVISFGSDTNEKTVENTHNLKSSRSPNYQLNKYRDPAISNMSWLEATKEGRRVTIINSAGVTAQDCSVDELAKSPHFLNDQGDAQGAMAPIVDNSNQGIPGNGEKPVILEDEAAINNLIVKYFSKNPDPLESKNEVEQQNMAPPNAHIPTKGLSDFDSNGTTAVKNRYMKEFANDSNQSSDTHSGAHAAAGGTSARSRSKKSFKKKTKSLSTKLKLNKVQRIALQEKYGWVFIQGQGGHGYDIEGNIAVKYTMWYTFNHGYKRRSITERKEIIDYMKEVFKCEFVFFNEYGKRVTDAHIRSTCENIRDSNRRGTLGRLQQTVDASPRIRAKVDSVLGIIMHFVNEMF